VFVLISLLVCLIPTTIGGLLSAIGIAGMDRLVQHNVLAVSGRAVEAAGDVNTLLLDKTGTITLGNRQASEFLPRPGVRAKSWRTRRSFRRCRMRLRRGGRLWCWRRSSTACAGASWRLNVEYIPFSALTRMSGVDMEGRSIRKGAADAIAKLPEGERVALPDEVRAAVDQVARSGGTPLVVAENGRALGVIHLKDIVKGGCGALRPTAGDGHQDTS
jgi:potassium-transporting ATPase ATP-binding subunit